MAPLWSSWSRGSGTFYWGGRSNALIRRGAPFGVSYWDTVWMQSQTRTARKLGHEERLIKLWGSAGKPFKLNGDLVRRNWLHSVFLSSRLKGTFSSMPGRYSKILVALTLCACGGVLSTLLQTILRIFKFVFSLTTTGLGKWFWIFETFRIHSGYSFCLNSVLHRKFQFWSTFNDIFFILCWKVLQFLSMIFRS